MMDNCVDDGDRSEEKIEENFEMTEGAMESYFCYVCYSPRTAEELEIDNDTSFKLSCGHQYCMTCLQAYLESKVLEGHTRIKCCCIADTEYAEDLNEIELIENNNEGETVETKAASQIEFCNVELSEPELEAILVNKPDVKLKYDRFKFLKENPNGRECPECSFLQIHVVDSSQPHDSSEKRNGNLMVCQRPFCSAEYCFEHANAHPTGMSCEEYERSIAATVEASTTAIRMISKPCPGCGIFVSKTDGCNHMKCSNCQQCFCWVCGVAVEDAIFPNHFQWWNAMGCANMQMVEDIEPTRSSIIFARVTAIAQTLVLGPISLASTIVSFIICFPCVYSHHMSGSAQSNNSPPAPSTLATPASTTVPSIPASSTPPIISTSTSTSTINTTAGIASVTGDFYPIVHDVTSSSLSSTLSTESSPKSNAKTFPWSKAIQGCISGWGFFYLCVLIIFPLAVIIGAIFIACWLIYITGYIISYPFYYYTKKKNGQQPKSFFSFFNMRRKAEAELLDIESGRVSFPSTSIPTPAVTNSSIHSNTNTNSINNVASASSSMNTYKGPDDEYSFDRVSVEDDFGMNKSGRHYSSHKSHGGMSPEEELELQRLEEGFSQMTAGSRRSGRHYTGHIKSHGNSVCSPGNCSISTNLSANGTLAMSERKEEKCEETGAENIRRAVRSVLNEMLT
mmetsp:Transcript_5260/g.9987  ORF Transcript_5260/g.9987 Transcript_5260/m.9987 type:complete len:680 (-) Transcript_5260:1800-3839(-)|eukprot:CAMPEP_0114480478 /NCGR_PEP_ID=MMETSP0104-20121206/17153_1 /TAXON_ID=37642 ORGANISM="Paraphysomonas imperforata, Strain PA2" /NCGR_SAMPLE_ID=MMETSP0104 /ASSEMBLY_ACC=CAM_ASM_000202 /LENGTH=679 /DNA_ID=CAMNT_0001655965 /DNA_START=54 /DNA_END=2093 /DNA_ORIENTATION=-